VTAGRVWQPGPQSPPLDHTAPPGTRPGGHRRGKCADTARPQGGCRCCQHLQPVQPSRRQMALTIQTAKDSGNTISRALVKIRWSPGGLRYSGRVTLGIVRISAASSRRSSLPQSSTALCPGRLRRLYLPPNPAAQDCT
jgi:hypothetical protein